MRKVKRKEAGFNMFKNISYVLIWSSDYKKLADWYKDKLGLKVIEEFNHPDDSGVSFEFTSGGSRLWIGQHSKVKGKNNDFHRHMINIDVDSVSHVYEYLKNRGVEFLAVPYKEPVADTYCATFYDLDRNLLQIVGPK